MLQSKHVGWIIGLKKETLPYAAYERLTSELNRLKMREWKKIFHGNGNNKISGVGIPIHVLPSYF